MSKLEKFLKESKLPEEAKALILEAWNDEKQDLAAEIRTELKSRYDEDKKSIVEGLQKLTENVLQTEVQSLHDEKRKLSEDRAVIRKNLQGFQAFSNKVLKEEVQKMQSDRKVLRESFGKFAQFSQGIMAEELKEFHQEKRELTETRVHLLAEGKRKINEAQKAFVKRAAEHAAQFIQEQTAKEFTELKEQLQEAKKNMFGRKIFEAFANEFVHKQYDENANFKCVMTALKESKAQNEEIKSSLYETQNLAAKAIKQVKVLKEQKERTGVLTKLLKPLTESQKSVMSTLLEKTPTEKLSEDFKRYLKPVLSEGQKPLRKATQIAESKSVVTGNRQNLQESVDSDAEFNKELESLAKFAGIRK